MCYHGGLVATLAAAFGWAGVVAAGPMLSGTVTYNAAAHLYTYSYTLDDRTAVAPVDQIYIRVAAGRWDIDLPPHAHAEPDPFRLGTAYTSSGFGDVAGGTLYGWNSSADWQSLTASVRDGFWFSTPYAPYQGGDDNYYVFSTAAVLQHAVSEGHLEYGRVVAPDFNQPVGTPEPGTLVLVTLGLAVVGLRASPGRMCQS